MAKAPVVKETKTPYEILIRFGEDGMPRGAHAQFIECLLIDGVVRSETLGNAEPLDLEGFPTSTLMSNTMRDALAELTRLRGELGAAYVALSEAQARIEELEKSDARRTRTGPG